MMKKFDTKKKEKIDSSLDVFSVHQKAQHIKFS